MSDLIERARSYVKNLGGDPQDYLVWQLADEIERLDRDIERLQIHSSVLMREIERLKALPAHTEIERLKDENNQRVCKLLAQIVAMRAEIERLTRLITEEPKP
jgi:predicted RNase H-like nuclease (RuvC/YqgF family)